MDSICDDDMVYEFDSNFERQHAAEFFRYFKLGNQIGRGATSHVFRGRGISDNNDVAVKVLPIKNVRQWKDVDGVRTPKEIIIHRQLSHIPGIVKFINSYDCKYYFMIVMELLPTSTALTEIIMERGVLSEQKAQIYIMKIAKILCSCCDAGVVHGDLHSGNILVDYDNDVLHLVDFGCSDYIKEEPFTAIFGAFRYFPPESFEPKIYFSDSSTVWGIGVLGYQMVVGKVPFITINEILKKDLEITRSIAPLLESFIRNCLQKDQDARPTLKDLLNYHFDNCADVETNTET